jgi:hypothetical protein
VAEDFLMTQIKRALSKLEESGDIVMCTIPNVPANAIYNCVRDVLPSDELSALELSAIRALIFQAVSDKRFFDSEMPTLTGLSAKEFKALVDKLPNI